MRSRQQNNTGQQPLPQHFVESLQRLFSLLDSQCGGTGKVPLELIASQWQNLQHQFPAGFLECLGRVAPPDGQLTFDRFLAGFRLVISNRQRTVRLKRVRSEGKLDEISAYSRLPAMGVNGLLVEQHRPFSSASNARALKAQYGSQPALNAKYIQPPAPILRLPESRDNYAYKDYDYYNGHKAEPFRRPASAGAGHLVRAGTETNTTTTSDSSPTDSNNYSVVMRSRSKGPTNPSTKQIRAPAPPQSKSSHSLHHILNGDRYRPASLTSSGSGSCSGSSGMAEVRWSNSRQSSSNSPPDPVRQYAEEHQPQVEKHEQLLREEGKIVLKGLEVTKQLLKWYDERVESLEKRKRMLKKGMVALDSAVHEQKLNFQRAQITALNRRMCALMTTTEKGFPSHDNLQHIRNPVKPPETPAYTSHDQPATTAMQLLKQNKKLAQELEAKSHQIDQLQRERRLQELKDIQKRGNEAKTRDVPNYVHRPAALVRPAMATKNYSQIPLKVHDTLL